MTWVQWAKEKKALIVAQEIAYPLIYFLFYVMIASLLVAAGDVDCLGFCLMGGLLPFSTTSISCAWHAPITDFGKLYLLSSKQLVFGYSLCTIL
jgi:hypothetical protein